MTRCYHDWVRQHLWVGWIVYTCIKCGLESTIPWRTEGDEE